MNIFGCFRSARVNVTPEFSGNQIAKSGHVLLACLHQIENSAEVKGGKVVDMYNKTQHYTKKLIKHAEKNKFNATYKDLIKLHTNAVSLLNSINNIHNKDIIGFANIHLSNITFMVGENKTKLG